jgi:hypothetical protein
LIRIFVRERERDCNCEFSQVWGFGGDRAEIRCHVHLPPLRPSHNKTLLLLLPFTKEHFSPNPKPTHQPGLNYIAPKCNHFTDGKPGETKMNKGNFLYNSESPVGNSVPSFNYIISIGILRHLIMNLQSYCGDFATLASNYHEMQDKTERIFIKYSLICISDHFVHLIKSYPVS